MESHDLRGAGLTQETGEHIQVLQYHTLNFSPSFVLLKVEVEQPQQKNPSCFYSVLPISQNTFPPSHFMLTRAHKPKV